MREQLGLVVIIIFIYRISVKDFRTYLISNLDLLWLLIGSILFGAKNFKFALLNFVMYLIIYLISQKQLGFGDVKLSLIIGLFYSGLLGSILAFYLSVILGGAWALISRKKRIAFAPWMILGALLTQILVV